MASVTHLAPDSGLVDISGEGLNLNHPATGIRLASVGDHHQEFTVGNFELGERIAREGPGIELTEAYTFQGGRLRIGSRHYPDGDLARVAVWEGENHSLYTISYGERASQSARMLAVLDLLKIDEVARVSGIPGGIIFRSREPGRLWFDRGPTVLKFIPTLGLIEIAELTKEVIRELPRWSGAPVPGGEIFADEENPNRRYFVLVSRTAKTLIMPAAGTTDAGLEIALSRLQIEWRRT